MIVTSHEDTSAHVARYEALRRHVVERQVLAGRFGLAVLQQQGLIAWVERWSKVPTPASASPIRTFEPAPLPDDISADVINVLAAMALSLPTQEIHP